MINHQSNNILNHSNPKQIQYLPSCASPICVLWLLTRSFMRLNKAALRIASYRATKHEYQFLYVGYNQVQD